MTMATKQPGNPVGTQSPSPVRIVRSKPVTIPPALSQLNPRLAELLARRGIHDPAQLSPDLTQLLSPERMPGIEAAAELIATAVIAGQRILIVGDFDADGATATALCVRALRAMGAGSVEFLLPDRQVHGYGLSPILLDAMVGAPPDLLITVDNGISAHAGVDAAKAMGIRVVVTDHHLPGPVLPAADAVVNPNLEGSEFGSPALAGVGVAFYTLAAVRTALSQRDWFDDGRPRPNLAQWLDLVAVGTVADVVPLDDNNRRLVAQGLARIRAQQCVPGIAALFAVAGRDIRRASSTDLGFVVGPRLNAAGRLEDMRLGVRCLLTDDPAEARTLAAELDHINRARRDIEQDMLRTALDQVDAVTAAHGGAQQPPDDPAEWVLFDDAYHQGVIGIVAGRLKEQWQRPVFVFAPDAPPDTDPTEAERLKGSGRSIPGLHLRDLLVEIDTLEPGLMPGFGGHAMAAGLTLPREALGRFRSRFAEIMQRHRDQLPAGRLIESDGALALADFSLDFAHTLAQISPWGTGFPEPVFDNCFAVIERTALSGGKHWRVRLRALDHYGELGEGSADGPVLTAVWFNVHDRLPGGDRWRLAYRLQVNEYRGQESLQLVVVAGHSI